MEADMKPVTTLEKLRLNLRKADENLFQEIQVYLLKKHNYGKGKRAQAIPTRLLDKLYVRLGEIETNG